MENPSELGLLFEELIRRGARDLLQKAIEVEVSELLARYGNFEMFAGQRVAVRNGHVPAHAVLTPVVRQKCECRVKGKQPSITSPINH